MAESRGNEDAVNYNGNGTVDRGLFEINSIHEDLLHGQDVFSPQVNVTVAHELWQGRGWQPWTTYVTGRYRAFL